MSHGLNGNDLDNWITGHYGEDFFTECAHDLVWVDPGYVGAHKLPDYVGHYRCRNCGAECGHPDELNET